MTALVTGGAASGKSAHAEGLILASPHRPRIYVAAMLSRSREDAARVERHRALRADKGFQTVERPLDLAGWQCPKGAAVLVECMTNLLANERYEPGGAGEKAAEAILEGVERIMARAGTLVVVTGDLFGDGVGYDADTARYLAQLGEINRGIAAAADYAAEVVCGIPVLLKGRWP